MGFFFNFVSINTISVAFPLFNININLSGVLWSVHSVFLYILITTWSFGVMMYWSKKW